MTFSTPQQLSSEKEQERLDALRNYEILDTPADGAFDRVTALAARLFDTPIALVTLVDEDRIWFKSHHGLDIEQIPRSPGLCASVILRDEAYIVKDAIHDPRTLANPLVAGDFGLRFYAAAPLITHEGHRLGTINVIDFKPRQFDPQNSETLHELAGIIVDQMELRLSVRKTISSLSQVLSETARETNLASLLTICAWSKKIKVDEEWLSFEEFLTKKLQRSITHGIHPDVAQEMMREFITDS